MTEVLPTMGFDLIEDAESLKRVEMWPNTGISRRLLSCVRLEDLVTCVSNIYEDAPEVFLKSMRKGFSARLSTARLLDQDPEIGKFLERVRSLFGDDVIVSRHYSIKRDSIGPLEARVICIDGELTSCSRPLYGLRHSVPSSLRKGAPTFLRSFLDFDSFPRSFALDIGVFHSGDREWVDVVEVNPISASTCYVNNTVFCEAPAEVRRVSQRMHMGFEYCYDYIDHPNRYELHRMTGIDYTPRSGDRYTFL